MRCPMTTFFCEASTNAWNISLAVAKGSFEANSKVLNPWWSSYVLVLEMRLATLHNLCLRVSGMSRGLKYCSGDFKSLFTLITSVEFVIVTLWELVASCDKRGECDCGVAPTEAWRGVRGSWTHVNSLGCLKLSGKSSQHSRRVPRWKNRRKDESNA